MRRKTHPGANPKCRLSFFKIQNFFCDRFADKDGIFPSIFSVFLQIAKFLFKKDNNAPISWPIRLKCLKLKN
jgi:hypothetical protein